MTVCPRCGVDNEVDRASCWNCLAPLHGKQAEIIAKGIVLSEKNPKKPRAKAPTRGPLFGFFKRRKQEG